MYIPRIRRISDVIKEIKKQDKDTMLNPTLIREWIKNEEVTCMKYGNAYAVNLDELYLSFTTEGGNANEEKPSNEN